MSIEARTSPANKAGGFFRRSIFGTLVDRDGDFDRSHLSMH